MWRLLFVAVLVKKNPLETRGDFFISAIIKINY